MKRLLLLTCLMCGSLLSLMAQQQLPEIYESKEALTARYQLSQEQQAELDLVLENRQSNFEEIEQLRSGNESHYWLKRKAIYLGEQGSIRMILDTPEQIAAYGALARKIRVEESEMIQAYLGEGKDKTEARMLLLKNKY